MKKIGLLVITNLIISVQIFSCCAEKVYRLFPIGELDSSAIFVEFNLNRNCKMDGKDFEFWMKGVVNLVSSKGDSLAIIQTIDTIDVIDCRCSYEDYYEKTTIELEITNSYLKALKAATEFKGFTEAELVSIDFNDTTNIQKSVENTDTSYAYVLQYKDKITINLDMDDIISCFPDKVAEIREYCTTNYKITILRMRCRLIEKQAVEHNKKRYVSLESAIWKEQAQWHGIAKDFMIMNTTNR